MSEETLLTQDPNYTGEEQQPEELNINEVYPNLYKYYIG